MTKADGSVTGGGYNGQLNDVTLTRPDASALSFAYDAVGNRTVATDGAGRASTWAFTDPALAHAVTSAPDSLGRATVSASGKRAVRTGRPRRRRRAEPHMAPRRLGMEGSGGQDVLRIGIANRRWHIEAGGRCSDERPSS